MLYQLEGYAGGQWHWKHVSADGNETATLFATEKQAKAAVRAVAKAQESDPGNYRIVQRQLGFGVTLEVLREAAAMSGPQLAEVASMSRQRLHQLEAGTHRPRWDEVQELAAALGVSTEAFRDQ